MNVCVECGSDIGTDGFCTHWNCVSQIDRKTPIINPLAQSPLIITVTRERLRDEFAMAALTGILASGREDLWFEKLKIGTADFAYAAADAMMKARGE